MASYAGRDKYEVYSTQDNRDKFVMDLKDHECSCRKFRLTDVKNYINNYYKKETYVNCYQHVIYSINGLNLWEHSQNDDVLPLVFRKSIGCPKLSRNKTGDEPRNTGSLSKLSREGQQQKCSYYFALGHNKRSSSRKRKKKAAQPFKKNANITRTSTCTTRTVNPIKSRSKAATRTQPKRKNNAQESRTSSKRAKCTNNNSQPQLSIITHHSPSRRTLKYMAKTPPRA
ncbi:hypothetical protein Ahy_B04g072359 [Arachis hypogaea]|uniref:Transposase MuDR plant domain-containing protein n=1 Tax=Arachis hypogaea TaxID=3818 RepID=A0A444ZMV9_ARAHY|nr:hypothetical protein Ahy_B04g072359 [Arachis hypogaea]